MKAAFLRIIGTRQGLGGRADRLWTGHLPVFGGARSLLDSTGQFLRGRDHALRFLGIELAKLRENRQQPAPGAAIAIPCREIGAAEEGLSIGRQQHGHRPAPAAGEHLHRGQVDGIDVGPLLAVHLDGDEPLIECASDLLVLEGLALHHVAPMAGRIADAEEHRLAFTPRALERLVAPRVPGDGIVRVLQ